MIHELDKKEDLVNKYYRHSYKNCQSRMVVMSIYTYRAVCQVLFTIVSSIQCGDLSTKPNCRKFIFNQIKKPQSNLCSLLSHEHETNTISARCLSLIITYILYILCIPYYNLVYHNRMAVKTVFPSLYAAVLHRHI